MSGRRRTSKWDLPQSPTEHGNSRMSFHDGGSDQISSGIPGSNSMKGSFVESSESRKHYSSNQVKESFSESRFSEKERDNMTSRDSMKDSESFDGGGNYSMRISPSLEEWRKRSRSPRSRPGRSLRSWSRSRSRSWSRSRSRSRSRSPSRGYKHESGVNDRCRSRSGLSTQPCRDFLSGKCRRGDDCHFLHQNNRNLGERRYPENGSPDGYESRHRRDGNSTYSGNDGRELPVREGRLLRERDDGIKNRDSSFERGGWRDSREPRRASDIPCRFFAAGNCRNGESCRFFHNAKAGSSFDGKSRDDRWAKEHTSDYPDQSRDSKRNDAAHGDLEMWNEDKHRNQGATWNEERHRNQDGPMRNEERHRNQGATWNEERPRNQDGPMRIEERHRNQDGSMRNEENHRNQDVVTMNDDKRRKEERPTWNEERHPSHGLSELKSRVGQLPRTDLDSNMILGGPGSFDKAVAINGSETFPLTLENTDSSRVANEFKKTDNTWLGDMEMSPEWNYTVQAPNDARNDKYGYVSRSTHSINLSEASLPTSEDNNAQDVSGQINHAAIATKPIVLENSYVQQYPRMNNDVVFPFNSRNLTGNGSGSNIDSNFSVNNLPGQNVYSNGLSSNVPSLYSTSSVVKSQPTLTTPSQGASQISSEFSTGQPSVSTEQIAQITNISASLAQIFGNQQQIPQLYAALNTAKAMGPLPSVPHSNKPIAPISAPTQPITASALFSPNSIAHSNIGDKKSELSVKDSTPISMTIGQNGGSFQGADNLEVQNPENEKLKHSELATIGEIKKKNEMVPEESKTVVPVSKKLGEDSPVDNMDEGGVNESKKSKEVKGLRAFKFALVECVKELLKTPWKEGKVNKDSYKVIVKKVSEKVTTTIQAANIPQTPEKIDQYLSFSKPKLTKLVQAYVEKYQKS